mmetsp:Transcript_54958/g.87043  ORF Transcript_54958/g.87043 Transcript_54958/m.87043 type:complete len:593 (+) Transcript_54958:115-1893(+)
MDSRFGPIGNTFLILNGNCGNGLVPETGAWEYGEHLSYEVCLNGGRIMFNDAHGCGVLVRGAEWLEGDVSARRVRLQLTARGDMLTHFKYSGESDWGEDIIATRATHPDLGARRRHHSIPNHIPWRLRSLYDSVTFDVNSQSYSHCHQDPEINESEKPWSFEEHDLEIAANTASDANVMTSKEDYAKRCHARKVGRAERHASKFRTWAGVVVDDEELVSSGNVPWCPSIDLFAAACKNLRNESKAAPNISEKGIHPPESYQEETFPSMVRMQTPEAETLMNPMSITANPVSPPCCSVEDTMDCVTSALLPETSANLENDLAADMDVTTLMIRNVPSSIKQIDLMAALDEDGFKGLYDFCYMPCSFTDGAGKGYAFVNFRSVVHASRLVLNWHRSRRFGTKSADNGLNICPAAKQGLEANLQKWDIPRLRRIRNPNLRPFVARDETSDTRGASLDVFAIAEPQEVACQGFQTLKVDGTTSGKNAQPIVLSAHLGCSGLPECSQIDVQARLASSCAQVSPREHSVEQDAHPKLALPLPRVPGVQLPISPLGPMLLGTLPMLMSHEKRFDSFGNIADVSPAYSDKDFAGVRRQQQ